MQVLFLAVLVNALHATLEDAEITLNPVGGYLAANIFLNGMVDGLMIGHEVTDQFVKLGLVRHETGFAGYVVENNLSHGTHVDITHDRALGAASGAVDQGQNLLLVIAAAFAFAL